MYKLSLLLIIGILASCGASSDGDADSRINKPSAPNEKQKPALVDSPISYFSQPGLQIKILKQFEFNSESDHFRELAFHYGIKLLANELTSDGRGCKVFQPLTTTAMGPIPAQSLVNVQPISRELLGREVPDDFQFYGIKFDFTVVGSGILYCFRHESLGPVTFEDFRDHFVGYLEFP